MRPFFETYNQTFDYLIVTIPLSEKVTFIDVTCRASGKKITFHNFLLSEMSPPAC